MFLFRSMVAHSGGKYPSRPVNLTTVIPKSKSFQSAWKQNTVTEETRNKISQ